MKIQECMKVNIQRLPGTVELINQKITDSSLENLMKVTMKSIKSTNTGSHDTTTPSEIPTATCATSPSSIASTNHLQNTPQYHHRTIPRHGFQVKRFINTSRMIRILQTLINQRWHVEK